jgi:hypothetical protein
MNNMRNGFIAGAGALYLWNIIDGWVAKGKTHVLVADNIDLNISPYISPSASGFSLTINLKSK